MNLMVARGNGLPVTEHLSSVAMNVSDGGFLPYDDAAANAQIAVIRRPLCGA